MQFFVDGGTSLLGGDTYDRAHGTDAPSVRRIDAFSQIPYDEIAFPVSRAGIVNIYDGVEVRDLGPDLGTMKPNSYCYWGATSLEQDYGPPSYVTNWYCKLGRVFANSTPLDNRSFVPP